MKSLAAGAVVLGSWLSVWSQPAGAGPGDSWAAATPTHSEALSFRTASAAALNELRTEPTPEPNDVIEQYCVRCHSEPRRSGNLSLEASMSQPRTSRPRPPKG